MSTAAAAAVTQPQSSSGAPQVPSGGIAMPSSTGSDPCGGSQSAGGGARTLEGSMMAQQQFPEIARISEDLCDLIRNAHLQHNKLIEFAAIVCNEVSRVRDGEDHVPGDDCTDFTPAKIMIDEVLCRITHLTLHYHQHQGNRTDDIKVNHKSKNILFIDWINGSAFAAPSAKVRPPDEGGYEMGLFSGRVFSKGDLIPIVYNSPENGIHVANTVEFFWSENPRKGYTFTFSKNDGLRPNKVSEREKPIDACKASVHMSAVVEGEPWSHENAVRYNMVDGCYVVTNDIHNLKDATGQSLCVPMFANHQFKSEDTHVEFQTDPYGDVRLVFISDLPCPGHEIFCNYGNEYVSAKEDFSVSADTDVQRKIACLNETTKYVLGKYYLKDMTFFFERLLWGLYAATSRIEFMDSRLVEYVISTCVDKGCMNMRIARALSTRLKGDFASQSLGAYISKEFKGKRIGYVMSGTNGETQIWSGVLSSSAGDVSSAKETHAKSAVGFITGMGKSSKECFVVWDSVSQRLKEDKAFETHIKVYCEDFMEDSTILSLMKSGASLGYPSLIEEKGIYLTRDLSRIVSNMVFPKTVVRGAGSASFSVARRFAKRRALESGEQFTMPTLIRFINAFEGKVADALSALRSKKRKRKMSLAVDVSSSAAAAAEPAKRSKRVPSTAKSGATSSSKLSNSLSEEDKEVVRILTSFSSASTATATASAQNRCRLFSDFEVSPPATPFVNGNEEYWGTHKVPLL